jgi:hypothetical protein
MFSLSCNLCPEEVRELLYESFFRVKILGDYVDGYAVVDDSVSAFDTDFCISWA